MSRHNAPPVKPEGSPTPRVTPVPAPDDPHTHEPDQGNAAAACVLDARKARHRAAQARYAKSAKGRAKRRAWYDADVRSGRKAERQRRYYANLSERQYAWMLHRNRTWQRRQAEARDEATLASLGFDPDDPMGLRAVMMRLGETNAFSPMTTAAVRPVPDTVATREIPEALR